MRARKNRESWCSLSYYPNKKQIPEFLEFFTWPIRRGNRRFRCLRIYRCSVASGSLKEVGG